MYNYLTPYVGRSVHRHILMIFSSIGVHQWIIQSKCHQDTLSIYCLISTLKRMIKIYQWIYKYSMIQIHNTANPIITPNEDGHDVYPPFDVVWVMN